jgi:hypothetical protein
MRKRSGLLYGEDMVRLLRGITSSGHPPYGATISGATPSAHMTDPPF